MIELDFSSLELAYTNALICAGLVAANGLASIDPLHLQVDWLHHLYTNAFSLV